MNLQDLYARQAREHSVDILNQPGRLADSLAWLRKDTADYWRHDRIRGLVEPLLHDTDASWITIGDGRYGTDAGWLIDHGLKRVVASDLQSDLLEIARHRKVIDEYRVINAERMDLPDESFDYVYCKEAYHHCPRAPVALFEMLRVARRAVILQEPMEGAGRNVVGKVVLALRSSIRRASSHGFERSGNFIYRVSRQEVEKALLGTGLRYYAFASIQDDYIPGVEHVTLDSALAKRLRRRIALKSAIGRCLGIDYGIGSFVLFKHPPDLAVRRGLERRGYVLTVLPHNPYS
jgi:SAM-dependent methyltransferase